MDGSSLRVFFKGNCKILKSWIKGLKTQKIMDVKRKCWGEKTI